MMPAEPLDHIALVGDDGTPIDAGCPLHSQHWLAVACRGNARNAGLPAPDCEHRPECEVLHAADDAHHDQVRADLEATRARLAARTMATEARKATRDARADVRARCAPECADCAYCTTEARAACSAAACHMPSCPARAAAETARAAALGRHYLAVAEAHEPDDRAARRREWSVRAADGSTVYASEDIARAIADGHTGYTLGLDQSPAVAAFTRATPDDEWEPLARQDPAAQRAQRIALWRSTILDPHRDPETPLDVLLASFEADVRADAVAQHTQEQTPW